MVSSELIDENELQNDDDIESSRNITVIEFQKEFWSLALYLVIFFTVVAIFMMIYFTPKIEGVKKLWMLFCILPPVMFLVLFLSGFRSRIMLLIIQNDKRYFIRCVTKKKYIYYDGEKSICYKLGKRQKIINSNKYKNLETSKEDVFIKTYINTRRGRKECLQINLNNPVAKWCRKMELNDHDKTLLNFPQKINRTFSESKYKWISDYPVVSLLRGYYGVKYKSVNNKNIIGKLKIVFNDDIGGSGDNNGGVFSTVFNVGIKNLDNIANSADKYNIIYSIIQTICKDTGMKMPEQ
ncbi:MAG: hypothetical protein LBU60_04205 [Clostridiales bacterium]|jgi:hypothetical protein|nr:hypothetical protein [Clostridiales bacterium]